jgi:hypothetical protein
MEAPRNIGCLFIQSIDLLRIPIRERGNYVITKNGRKRKQKRKRVGSKRWKET